MNKEELESIEKVKYLIEQLSCVQDLYYASLVDKLGILSEQEDWLFDYIFNSSGESLETYLKKYGKTIEELTNE